MVFRSHCQPHHHSLLISTYMLLILTFGIPEYIYALC
jgi:hypothetical protein